MQREKPLVDRQQKLYCRQHRHLRYWGLTSIFSAKTQSQASAMGLDLVLRQTNIFSTSLTLKALPTGRTYKASLQQRKCSNVGGYFVGHNSLIKIKHNNLIPQSDKPKSIFLLIPVLGSLLFVVFYVIATLLYPGGSQVDKNSIGFSWTNNYWCNLLNDNAINGQRNPAKPIALIGMLVLCLTLSFFWFIFPRQINISKKLKLTIQVSGILAMAVAFFLFTDINHDFLTNLASSFGVIATAGTFIGLYKNKLFGLFTFGFLNILLVLLTNLCYYNKKLIIFLPVIQKITFATFLIWVCCIAINLYRRKTATNIGFYASWARQTNIN
ncbi:MAG: hypothetical protein U0T79_09270 [Ferruginibacter sp.]